MKKTNILIFMTDQQRGSTITDPRCLTPNIDKLRQKGVTFDNAFCPSPHCCPSRATFMSGLYPSEHGVWNNVNVTNAISTGLNEGVRLWSEDLSKNGYDMYYHGKWHVSADATPKDYGWQEGLVTANAGPTAPQTCWEYYQNMMEDNLHKAVRKNSEITRPGWGQYSHYGIDENPFNDKGVVDDAINMMQKSNEKERPWCRFVGTLGPHDPYYVPQRFLDMYDLNTIELPDSFTDNLKDRPNLYQRTRDIFTQLSEEEHREALRHYFALCTYEDYLFGKVIDALEAEGELENTLIVYTSDHGDYTAEHGLWCKGLPCFKGAYEIPFIVAGPDIVNPGRIVSEFISLADFAPTLLELIDINVDQKFSGQSLIPFLRDKTVDEWRDAVFTQSNGNEQYGIQRSVMTREWKYVYNGFDYDELYDLENDPLETYNLINEKKYQGKIKELCTKMWKFAHATNDNCLSPYIMIGFAPYGPQFAFS